MDILQTKFNFNHLSVRDLVEARDLFHVHLINKKNVVATAIGRYRIRKSDPWPNEKSNQDVSKPRNRGERTLENSEVRDYSWPCILVFVTQWSDEKDLINDGESNIVPNNVYLPDGRIVPICVVEAPKSEKSDDTVDTSKLNFPKNLISGGFPLIVYSQGQERIASLGCLVSDGNKVYTLTNRHVTGNEGTVVYTKLGSTLRPIGTSSSKQLGKIKFTDVYKEWSGTNLLVNNDIGLIEIEDVNLWKTEVFGIGQLDTLASLDTSNMTLNLINAPVVGYGAVSGQLQGEVVALFYRYKAIGARSTFPTF